MKSREDLTLWKRLFYRLVFPLFLQPPLFSFVYSTFSLFAFLSLNLLSVLSKRSLAFTVLANMNNMVAHTCILAQILFLFTRFSCLWQWGLVMCWLLIMKVCKESVVELHTLSCLKLIFSFFWLIFSLSFAKKGELGRVTEKEAKPDVATCFGAACLALILTLC